MRNPINAYVLQAMRGRARVVPRASTIPAEAVQEGKEQVISFGRGLAGVLVC